MSIHIDGHAKMLLISYIILLITNKKEGRPRELEESRPSKPYQPGRHNQYR